ncbi:MAG TPA: ABC transporter ATP-binding protein [Solirubrobacteraceae bacterium]|jgi:iron(III) transport system ATP-binding protein|nr:ABC transporter ATP-binding protein [Solirubrobacteraceae bacterium]
MSAIELRDASKAFGATRVLEGVALDVPERSITAVLGASGSGKTTLLRIIAGFEALDGGTLTIGGRLVDDARRLVPAQHRGVGYVPQEGALFPHLTVRGNVGFGLARSDRARVGELLDLVGLRELDRRYPHQLSGGQQQRVALARALAIEPSVVLLDEPFSALDASLRSELRRDVARILSEAATTTVLVTHDQGEALALADQIALLADGTVIAAGAPRRLYQDPPALDAAASIGELNLLSAHASGGRARTVLGEIPIVGAESGGSGAPIQGRCQMMLRPEQLAITLVAGDGHTAARVLEVQYLGHDALAHVRVDDASAPVLLARIPGELGLTAGQAVWIEVTSPGRAWPAS